MNEENRNSINLRGAHIVIAILIVVDLLGSAGVLMTNYRSYVLAGIYENMDNMPIEAVTIIGNMVYLFFLFFAVFFPANNFSKIYLWVLFVFGGALLIAQIGKDMIMFLPNFLSGRGNDQGEFGIVFLAVICNILLLFLKNQAVPKEQQNGEK